MNRIALSLLAGVAALGFASASYAADLIIDAPVVAPGIVEVGGDWDGAFVGVFGGYATAEIDPEFGTPDTFDADGWLLGVNAGANFTLTDGIVAGIVGDIAWANLETDDFFDEDAEFTWQGSVRGRLGFDGGSFLPYVTAGVAFANMEGEDLDDTLVGWTAGAGIEFKATDDLSVDLAYRYSDYGSNDFGGDFDTDVTAHQVTVGLNWHF